MSVGRTWTAARIELLKSGFAAGLSCSQIADEIGVSRNAVIGKLNRLKLSRFERRTVRARPQQGRKVTLRLVTQHDILSALRAAAPPPVEELPVQQGPRCSLADLGEGTCRWPLSDPGHRDFGFCGGAAVNGLPYCAAHARIAYQPAAGQRSARR